MSTFVTVGNSLYPFRRLLDEVARLASEGLLPAPIMVQHGHTPFSCAGCEPRALMDRVEFESALDSAQLVITHGGLTVFRAMRAGKVPVVMPRRVGIGESADDHQVDLTKPLADEGRIALATEPAELRRAVTVALELQHHRPASSHEMAAVPLVLEIKDLLHEWSLTKR